MQHKSSHENEASAKLTFVVLSGANKPSRTFKASKIQLAIVVVVVVGAVSALSILAMIHTPLGKYILPAYFSTQEEQLERVQSLAAKVDTVQKQLTYLASYNLRLRNALGDTATSPDAGSPAATEESRDESSGAPVTNVPPQAYNANYQSAKSAPVQVTSPENGPSILPFIMPVSGFVSRDVNYTIQHYGVDISANSGEPIVAPAPGQVIFTDWTVTGGNTLIIVHPGDFVTVYKHCERILTQVGARVSRGEAIALVGSTGVTSTGPHLHFELWQDGKNLDPMNYLLTKN
ncbi:MAG TPA: M23 family metallopeptidase [Candidatus Kryptonia bacterium]